MFKEPISDKKKVYYFDFGTSRKKKISCVFGMIIFLFISFFFDALILFCFSYFANRIQNQTLFRFLFYAVMLSAVVFKIFGIAVQFFPRKIVLTDSRIEIRYNNFCWLSSKVFSLNIKYEKLESCELNALPKSMFMGRGGVKVPFVSFNQDSLVILHKKFRVFAIPVENAEDFVAEVNNRMDLAKQKIMYNVKQ